MANFDVSYFIRLRDQFSGQADKASRAANKLKGSLSRLSAQAKKVGSSMVSAGKSLTLFATVPIALAARSLINAASEAEETGNRFKEVFKGLDSQRDSAVVDLGKQFHLAASSAQELLSDSGDLLSGLGLTKIEALELSKSMIALSADVTSFKNVKGGVARTMNAFTKALLGEREMLKETFKISILESEVKEAANILMAKNLKLTEKQARAFATVNMVTKKSQNSLGDYNRTQKDYANLTRQASERTKELTEKFGVFLLPAMVKITNKFIELIDYVNSMSASNKKLTLIIVGVIAVLGPLALVIGAVAFAVSGLAAAFALLTGPILLIIAAVALLGVAVFKIWQNWDKLVAKMTVLWQDFSAFMSTAMDSIGEAFTNLGNFAIVSLKKIYNGIIDFLLTPIKLVAQGLAALGFEGLESKLIEFEKKITFDVGNKKLGIDANSSTKSQADVNINLNAPKGVVASTTAVKKGSPMNLGLSMGASL